MRQRRGTDPHLRARRVEPPQVRALRLVGQRQRAPQLAHREAARAAGKHPPGDRGPGLRLRPGGQVAGRADELLVHRVEQVPRPGDELRVAAHRAGLVIGHPSSLPAVSRADKWQQPASSSPRPRGRGRL